MTTTSTARFTKGDRVVDRDGCTGTVINVTYFEGSHLYDVRFNERSVAVRYDEDLERTE